MADAVVMEEEATIHEVNMEFGRVQLATGDNGTDIMLIHAKALDEGVWNGMYFNMDDIKEKIPLLEGRRVLVSHEYEDPNDVKGWVERVDGEHATLRVFDADTITRVQDGELNSVSVGVQIQHTNGVATILDFNEISLTGNPACTTCTIEEAIVTTLEKKTEVIEMTETTVEIETCTCEGTCECLEAEAPEETVETTEEVVEDKTPEITVDLEYTANLESRLIELEEEATVLRDEKRRAEFTARVECLMDEARYKPANSDNLINFLMSLDEDQIAAWNGVESGLGAVVPLDDLGETAEFNPDLAQAAEIKADKAEMRRLMGYKTE